MCIKYLWLIATCRKILFSFVIFIWSKITNIANKETQREGRMEMNVGKENKEGYKRKEKKWIGEIVLYDISSWSETERRNEMTLKAAFNEWNYIYK